MPDGGEPGHVRADLGEDHIGAGQADAGDLIEPGYRVGERGGPRPIRGWRGPRPLLRRSRPPCERGSACGFTWLNVAG